MTVGKKLETVRKNTKDGLGHQRLAAAVDLIHEEERRTLPGTLLLAAVLVALGGVAFAVAGPPSAEPATEPTAPPPMAASPLASLETTDSTAAWEKAAEHMSLTVAEQIFAGGVDTAAELEAYEQTGDLNGAGVLAHLRPLVQTAERERAEEAARIAAEKAAAEEAARRKAEAARQAVSAPKAPASGSEQAAPSGTTWSRGQVESTLRSAAGEYGLSAADTEWIVSKGADIAWSESRYRTAVVNSSGHAGLFQFSSSWGSLEQRTDPVWSCYRFVKVFKDGGKAKIVQHWAATY